MTEIRRSPDCGNSPKNVAAQEIALALMGVGALPGEIIAEAASWDRPTDSVTGRDEILAAAEAQSASAGIADLIRVEQVVTHGKASSVSGRVTRGAETRLFCHVIRFTPASAKEIAHLVSFEHPAPSAKGA